MRICLADLYIKADQYESALNFYVQVSSMDLADTVFFNRMQCLYHMGWYATLAEACEIYLEGAVSDSEKRVQAAYFLSISLYRQSVGVSDAQTSMRYAQRAEPYFEMLLQDPLTF